MNFIDYLIFKYNYTTEDSFKILFKSLNPMKKNKYEKNLKKEWKKIEKRKT